MAIPITGMFEPSGGAGAFNLYDPADMAAGNVNVALQLISGGQILAGSHATAPVGEVVIQRRTSTGAPNHAATEGTLCWNTVDNQLYCNSDGATAWTLVNITDHGTLSGLADDDHPQYALDTDLTTHIGAADPHTGYRLESADHTHQSTGAQAGQLDHGLALTGLSDDDHSAYLLASDATNRATFASNWIDLTDAGITALHKHTLITDADGDTKIQAEEAANENILRFDTAGTQRMVIADDGHVIVGGDVTDDEIGTGNFAKFAVRVEGISETLGLAFSQHSSLAPTSVGAMLSLAKSRGSMATPSSVSSGDMLSSIAFYGYDSANYVQSAYIRVMVDAATGVNDIPSRMSFATTPDGGTAPIERLRINNAGGALFGIYGRFGSASTAPTNTTAGDLTATRLVVPDAAILHSAICQLGGPVVIPTQGALRFSDSDNSHYTGFKAHATTTASVEYTWPAADGSSGQQLTTDGAGVLSWAAAGGGGGSPLTVQEEDGTPIDAAVTIIRVPNGGLTDNGVGDVSLGYELSGAVSTHAGAADPHTGYVLESVVTTRGDLYRRGAAAVERLPTATDRKSVMFDGTDASYQYVIETGTYASRPAASTANVGRLYMATDRQNTLYRCKDATTWVIVNPRRFRLEWYIDGRQYADDATRQGPIRRIPSDMGPFAPIRATANLKTAATEGANRTGTATSGTTTTLTDSGKAWTVNQWTGAVCSITAGTNNGKKGRVASNTATQLTFENAFSAAIDATSVYSIESGIRVNFESGASATPSTNSFTQPASDTTTDNRLTITPTNVENTASTFNVASYAADDRIEMIIHGVGADANGATGEDLTVVLEIEQTDG